jgi:FlaA1/EpsC-like NDP-sugar epimerase
MTKTGNRIYAPQRLSKWLVLGYDVVLSMGIMAAVLIWRYRFEPKPLPSEMVWRATLAFGAVSAIVFPIFDLHRGLWRYTALRDIARIVRAVVFANLLLLPVLFLTDRLTDFPRTGLILEAPAIILVLSLSRLAVRGWRRGDLAGLMQAADRDAPLAVVIADPPAADAYLSEISRNGGQRLRPAGVITPTDHPRGGLIHGVELMGGMTALSSVLTALRESGREVRAVIAELRPGRELMQAVVKAAAEAGVKVERRRTAGAPLSPIEAADLLDRPPRHLDAERAAAMVRGRNVMVTGAGGTIGSELTRQIMDLDPACVTLVDASEYNLYAMDMALREARARAPWRAELADVRDQVRMTQLFDAVKPDVVLHAAALKHVPLMETHPCEAVLTNIGGARIVAELARDRAFAFVFISTDKAVNPTNVMGATKRVAEQVVRAICAGSRTRASVVRFGNVLGSTGSVAPLFERQIAEGGPVTVTHPDMERYFMTVREAASLVLQAASLPVEPSAEGGVYVLDMGESVKIDDLARQMILLHGLKPDHDIAVRYTGLRPGEKLFEEIFYEAEQVRQTDADGVLSAFAEPANWEELEPPVARLLETAARHDDAAALALLGALAPEFVRPA